MKVPEITYQAGTRKLIYRQIGRKSEGQIRILPGYVL
jgi:hypothetical protein